MGNIVVDICYKPPDQEEADEAFFRQLKKVFHLQSSWETSTRYILKAQHSRAQTIQEVSGVQW